MLTRQDLDKRSEWGGMVGWQDGRKNEMKKPR